MALQPPPFRLNGASREAESDEVLAARVMALADPAAFETLVRRHQRRVHYLLERFTGNRAVAEELSQETFLRAWRKLGSFENRGAFAGWLTKLAWNVFLQHRRRNRVAEASGSLEEPNTASAAEQAATAPGPTDALPELERLLAAVSPEEQRLLVLTYAEGLSATEIGEMLTDHDPLDDLLRAAFAAHRARMPPVDVAGRVLARIRRQARLRALTLGALILSGLIVVAASLEPALAVLREVARGAPHSWHGDTLAVTVLVLAGAAWLVLVEGDAA